ncbi:Asp23/Gls24 family envelope stress response protein [Terrabacter sp. NPDC080008]|uniref:Asp23/Gls24 family envelope stress response protein n=1 Tax=Terrabacter sp. NPDC080008 TaxID=3155176 RepID=UPI00344E67E1
MTELVAAPPPQPATAAAGRSGTSLPDPAQRGRLDIAERVVERVAGIAACEVAGVRSVGSTLEGVVGRQYPKVRAEVAGGHARLSLDIAVSWPVPLARTAAEVREHVGDRLAALLGLKVDAVDVTVATVSVATTEYRRVQ